MANVICNCGNEAKYKGNDIRHNYSVAKYEYPVCGRITLNEDEIEVYDDREEL